MQLWTSEACTAACFWQNKDGCYDLKVWISDFDGHMASRSHNELWMLHHNTLPAIKHFIEATADTVPVAMECEQTSIRLYKMSINPALCYFTCVFISADHNCALKVNL